MIRQYCSKIHMVHRIKLKGCKKDVKRYDPPSSSSRIHTHNGIVAV